MPLHKQEYPNIIPSGDNEIISFREFARRVGCAENSVRYAIQEKKIKTAAFQTSGMKRPKIAYEIGLIEWKAAGMLINQPEQLNQNNSSIKTQLNSDEKKDIIPNGPPAPPAPPSYSGNSLTELKRQAAQIDLNKKKLELAEYQGTLVLKSKVYTQLRRVGMEIRDNILRIPDRVVDAMLAAGNRNDAVLILEKEITDALQTLSDVDKIEFRK